MSIEQLLVQLGVAGGTLVVLYRLVPAMLGQLQASIGQLSRSIDAAAKAQSEAVQRLARLEGKLDALHGLTPTHPEPIPRYQQTPPRGVPTVGGAYAQHRPRQKDS